MKNLLIQWEIKEENRKNGDGVPPIDRTPNGGVLFIDGTSNSVVLLIDRTPNGGVLLIDRELAELENDTECVFLPKLTDLVKKSSNLTRTGKEKLYRPISHSLACFVEPIRRPHFRFVEALTGLTDGLAMGGAESRGGEVAIGFSR